MHAIYARTRLLEWLDAARRRPVIWVEGPPGSGKTTLVASYLEQRRLPCLWYQLDAGDTDVATFFHYLSLAARSAVPRRRRPLPSLTPAYLADLRAFARRYFEELNRRLKPPWVIVLDNYQEVDEGSPLHEALSEAAERLPAGISLIVVSRAAPPAAWARNRVHDAMAILDESGLRLNPDEARGVAQLRSRGAPHACVEKLHELAHGWMAGFILLLGRAGVHEAAPALEAADRQVLFNYFAQEVFRKFDAATQGILGKTSVLPYLTAKLVQQLTAEARAAAVLADLHRRNYFVARQAQGVYQYHPLFRQFLQTHLNNALTPVELVRLQHRGAQLLEKAGSLEEAVELYRLADDWGAVTRLILSSAPALLQQSRHRTLARWIGRLPAAVVEPEPWLLYWRGLCRMLFAPVEARRDLERAYAAFDTRDDPVGLYLSWAAIIDTFSIELANFTPLDKWIAAFESLRARHPRFPSPEIETRVVFGAVGAFANRRPEHPELPAWAERAEQLLDSIPDINQRILSGMVLVHYYLWLGRFDRAAKSGVPLAASADVEPQCRLIGLIFRAIIQWCFGDTRVSFRLIEEGSQIIESHGLQYWKYLLWAQGVYAGCACGNLEFASRSIELMSPLADGRPRMDVALYHHLASMVAWHRQDLSSAATHAETALAIAEEIGQVFAEACCQFMVATLSFAQGETEKAALHLITARRLGERMRSPWVAYMCHMGEAYFAFQQGRLEQTLQLLREALPMSRERGTPSLPWMPHAVLARLYAAALEHDIERDHVQSLIRKFGIAPDDNAFLPDTWPFPLKIYTLGRFSVLVDDRPLTFSGKSQKKPMELLKALIALGGREVSEAKLAEALWPEAEGDAAAQSLATTLHRLRKLIGEDTIER